MWLIFNTFINIWWEYQIQEGFKTQLFIFFKEILVQDHFYRKFSVSHVFSNWIFAFHSWWWLNYHLIVRRGWAWGYGKSDYFNYSIHTAFECYFNQQWLDYISMIALLIAFKQGIHPSILVIIWLPLSIFWRSIYV